MGGAEAEAGSEPGEAERRGVCLSRLVLDVNGDESRLPERE